MKNLLAPTLPVKSPGSKLPVPLSKSSVYLRLGILGILITPLLILVLQAFGYEVKLWGCPLKALVGIPCPTWGMTRAVFAIAHTQWSTAIQHHLLSPLVVILWGVALVQCGLELFTQQIWSRWWQRRTTWAGGLLLMFGYHGYRLYGLWTSGTLAADMQKSWLSHLM